MNKINPIILCLSASLAIVGCDSDDNNSYPLAKTADNVPAEKAAYTTEISPTGSCELSSTNARYEKFCLQYRESFLDLKTTCEELNDEFGGAGLEYTYNRSACQEWEYVGKCVDENDFNDDGEIDMTIVSYYTDFDMLKDCEGEAYSL